MSHLSSTLYKVWDLREKPRLTYGLTPHRRRSDRIWRYATVHEVRSQHILFKVKEDGSTKKVRRHHFAERVRLPQLTKTNAQDRRDLVAGKNVGVFKSWRSEDETAPECESHGSSFNSLNQPEHAFGKDFSDAPYSQQSLRSTTQSAATNVPLSSRGSSDSNGTSSASERNKSRVDPPAGEPSPAAGMNKRYVKFTRRRRRFSLRRADSNAAGIHYLGEKEVLSDEGSEKAVAGSNPQDTARRRGNVAKFASKVARRLSYGKKHRADSKDSQGNTADRCDSDMAAAIEEVKKWDEQEEAKGSVAPKQPPVEASRRRGSITNMASQALRSMPHEKSRRPTRHESKRTMNLTTSGIFKSLMAGELDTEHCTSELKQPSRSNRGTRRPTESDSGTPGLEMQDAAEIPIRAASTTKQSRRGRRVTVPNEGVGVRRELSSSILFKRGIANLLMNEKKRASCPNLEEN